MQAGGKFADREKYPFPCLVLLDLKLPYVMGLEVLRSIRSQPGAALPIIMLTASGEDADIAAAYRLGANAFLVKPSEVRKLDDMVTAIKHFWLTHNTLPKAAEPFSQQRANRLVTPAPRTLINGERRQPSARPSEKPRPENEKQVSSKRVASRIKDQGPGRQNSTEKKSAVLSGSDSFGNH